MPKPHLPGIFITFEGTEGAGKSTLIGVISSELQKHFAAEGLPTPEITITREPGGNAVAEKIRSVILGEPMDPWCELFLYEAARAEHLAKTILPTLKRGGWVLCDRFADSSLAYQAEARGLPWNQVKTLNRLATQGLVPHLTVLVDVDPAVGLERARDKNRFEHEGLAFQVKVRKGFLRARREDPKRWMVLAAGSATPEENARKVVRELIRKFGAKKTRSTRGKAKR